MPEDVGDDTHRTGGKFVGRSNNRAMIPTYDILQEVIDTPKRRTINHACTRGSEADRSPSAAA
jgi:hypothetical protein